MYILDTNVVSELRKGKKADRNVRVWAQTLPAASLYLSVVSILELEMGILLVERRDPKQGGILRAWMDGHVSCLHFRVAFWRLIPLWPSDARHSMCQILARIVML